MIQEFGKMKTDEEYIATFAEFPGDSKEAIREKMKEYKRIHMNCVIVSGVGRKFDESQDKEGHFGYLKNVADICRELDMKFFVQDEVPFPTGAADGALKLDENRSLNKIFLDERHCDMTGPIQDVYIRTDDLMRSAYSSAIHTFNGLDLEGRSKLAIVAYRMLEDSVLDDGSAVLLDDLEEDGFVHWDVPEGHWRVFVLFTIYESSGRPYYMNLLNRESVRLEMEKVHIPTYEHLKDELGKTWIGFFYDEPEIGNNGGNMDFDFQMLPGKRQKDVRNAEVYPWSLEMPAELQKRDKDWKKHLPFVFYDGREAQAAFRVVYMDAVTALVRDNYGGQIHEFSREHGITYLGHVLKDENSHVRLGCGSGHYFRQQYYQDQAGVDVIAGQIRPGCDQEVSWYGVPNANGELYYYGIAKLASSEARINPLKKDQSIVENLAVCGTTSSPEYKKFLTDHLVIQGLNHIILCDTKEYGEPEEFLRETSDYTIRMCQLIDNTRSVIKTAVLYHAEMEWAGGTEMFHKPAAVLAQNQISYDVIPVDVFGEPEKYLTDIAKGLVINGNRYEALIIPGCEYLPDEVYAFIKIAEQTKFPVFIENFAPRKTVPSMKDINLESYVVPKENLASAVRAAIHPDVEMENAYWVRYAQREGKNGRFYLFHNEAALDEYDGTVKIQATLPIYRINPVDGIAEPVTATADEEGFCTWKLHLDQFEMAVFYSGKDAPDNVVFQFLKIPYGGKYMVSVPGISEERETDVLENMYHKLGPKFDGKIVYRFMQAFHEFCPRYLSLGKVYENAVVYVNGEKAGTVLSSPYIVDIQDNVHIGENEFRIEVYNTTVNYPTGYYMGMPASTFTGVAQTVMEPAGLLGPVNFVIGWDVLPEVRENPEDGEWYRVTPEGCVGAFGDSIYGTLKRGSENNLIVCFCGGGVAWDEYMAARPFSENHRVEEGGYYSDTCAMIIDALSRAGIGSNCKENPFRNWNMIIIPYCTGDFHVGTGDFPVRDLDGKNRNVHFHGYTNYHAIVEKARKYLDCTPDKLIVTGFSAGAFAVSMLTDDVMNQFPEAKKTYSLLDSALLLHPDWKSIAENVWQTPKMISGCLETENIVLDSLLALKKKRKDKVQILYLSSVRDVALATYVGGEGIHRNRPATKEMCDTFQDELKKFKEMLQKADPEVGFYFFDMPAVQMEQEGSASSGATQHTILMSSSVYKIYVEGKTVLDWLQDAVSGEVSHIGVNLLSESVICGIEER